MRRQEKLPSLSNVQAGSTATLRCPVRLTYELVTLKFSGVTLEQMKAIEVRVNGKVLQRYADGVQLDRMNRFYGRPAASGGFVTLWFVRPELIDVREQRMTALGTADVQTLDIQIDIDPAASAPQIEAFAVQSAPQPMGLVTKIKQFPRSFATSGEQEIDSIPLGGAMIAAIHCFKSDVSAAEVLVNSVRAFEGPKALIESVQKNYGRTPQSANATHIDWLLDGDLDQALQTENVQDFRVKPTIGSQGLVDVVVEYLDGWGGL